MKLEGQSRLYRSSQRLRSGNRSNELLKLTKPRTSEIMYQESLGSVLDFQNEWVGVVFGMTLKLRST